MATGQGSMQTKETRSSLPTMSKERMGKSYSIRGYMTQCTTCMTHVITKPMQPYIVIGKYACVCELAYGISTLALGGRGGGEGEGEGGVFPSISAIQFSTMGGCLV